jgi:cellobiose-specific phosphotransferase system component IIA
MRSPITTERQNIQLLRDSGFTQQQAEAVVTVVARAFSGSSGQASLIDAIQEERIAAADARLEEAKAQSRRAWRIQGAIIASIGIATAIIKLFPN